MHVFQFTCQFVLLTNNYKAIKLLLKNAFVAKKTMKLILIGYFYNATVERNSNLYHREASDIAR